MARFGYARVSSGDQNLDLQTDALAAEGIIEVFTDTISGTARDRPGLDALLAIVQPGDVITVWRLDRLGRSVSHLAELLRALTDRGIWVRSLTDGVDTSTPAGRLIAHVMASVAEYDRESIRERQRAGIEAAKLRGKHLGRRMVLTPDQRRQAALWAAEGRSQKEIAALFGVSKRTVQRLLGSATV